MTPVGAVVVRQMAATQIHRFQRKRGLPQSRGAVRRRGGSAADPGIEQGSMSVVMTTPFVYMLIPPISAWPPPRVA